MSPYLPVTSDQIAEASISAAKAGAAIVHLHARNPETAKPDHSLATFAAFLPQIKQSTDAVINLTSGGAPYMGCSRRIQ
jgi:uncharacterized protein (DUF849 family)